MKNSTNKSSHTPKRIIKTATKTGKLSRSTVNRIVKIVLRKRKSK